jgi:hypothetical protein
LITTLIAEARRKAEDALGRSLIVHSWQIETFNTSGVIYLPMPPHNEITTVEYYDGEDWVELDYDNGDWEQYGLNELSITVSTAYSPIRVTFTTTAYDMGDIDRIMMELISVWYDHRPDMESLESRVIEKLGKHKKWQAA